MIQNTIIFILGFTILITTMLIIIVGFLGVLRVMIITTFEYDYVKAFRERKAKKKQKEEEHFKEMNKSDVHMGYYIRKGEQSE